MHLQETVWICDLIFPLSPRKLWFVQELDWFMPGVSSGEISMLSDKETLQCLM